MGKGRKANKFKPSKEKAEASNCSVSARNLRTCDLGAVVFGCKNMTFQECMQKQLFGLPHWHMSYVKNVTPGMILFLFNYTDRKLHGIFEAASQGQLNIDPYAWTSEGDEDTPFAAQVRMRARQLCSPLSEDEFRPIIVDNYRTQHNFFWFELDHKQTGKLVSMFLSSPLALPPKSAPPLSNRANWNTTLGAVHGNESKEIGDSSNVGFEANMVDSPPQDVLQATGGPPGFQRTWSSLFKQTKQESHVPLPSEGLIETDAKNMHLSAVANAQTSKIVEDTNSFAAEEWSWETEANAAALPTESQLCDEWLGESEGNTAAFPTAESQYADEWLDETKDNATAFPANELQQADESSDESEGNTAAFPTAESQYADEWLDETKDNATAFPANELQQADESSDESEGNAFPTTSELQLSNNQALLVKLMNDIGCLKGHQLKQDFKNHCLQHELAEAKLEIMRLRNQYNAMACNPDSSFGLHFEEEVSAPVLDSDECILVVGGFDGSSWLKDFSCYSPSRNLVKHLPPMTSARTNTSAAKACGELFVLGGKHGDVWSDMVESYNPASDEWFRQPSLNQRKGSLASVSILEKVYAIGGGNEKGCLSEVEMLDLGIGKWILSQPMQHKRFDPAVANINGSLYVVGGYDGMDYLKSVERFDPREQKWTLTGSMSSRRACHSVIALNEKIYALGGFNSTQMVPTIEVFDPRVGSWMMKESMNVERGYFGAVALGEKIYAIGGMKDGNTILESIECYKEGHGWELTGSSALGKRCFSSALTL